MEQDMIYDRFEMFIKLKENPERTAVSSFGDEVYMHADGIIRWLKHKVIEAGKSTIAVAPPEEKWRIIEPEPPKWKPKYGEAYYVPCLDCIGFKREIYVGVDTWQIKNGLYYQTQAEADAETNRILKLREDEQK